MNTGVLGVIFGNRDFFPDHLVGTARKEVMRALDKLGLGYRMLEESDTKLGGVETFADAQKCANLFKAHREEMIGILVVLPNFGDERGIAETIRLSGLDLPVLVQAYPDDLDKLDVARRRDAWCGKISVCNNLYQYGIKYSLTEQHVIRPDHDDFVQEVKDFAAVCRVVRGLKGMRIGAIGARPGGFNTVRYSEKILQRQGITVVTADLSEILGRANRIKDDDTIVKERIENMLNYAKRGLTPDDALVQMAKLDLVLQEFVEEHALDATALQCWTSLQENYGCNVCTSMSMMSENMLPSACEVDVTGTLTMYAMQLASGSPSALVDWNNNYADDPNKTVLFHCGNWAKAFLPEIEISNAPILGSSLGVENTWGALDGRTPASPLTYGRVSTDDVQGKVKVYLGEGELTDDELHTFGNRAVAQIPNLQGLMQYVCRNGFEHHVVMNASKTSKILEEALGNYFSWDVYNHDKKVMEESLVKKSIAYRKRILKYIYKAKAGHTGGSLSCVDILNVLYNRVMNVGPANFESPDRDRYVQSKGHCVEALFVVLADQGFFPESELETLCQYDSHFIGHPTRKVPGVEQNTGALGHGLSLSVGMAIAAKLDDKDYKVFTLMGDGELAEGSNWEAALTASHYKLDNLCAIIDYNKLQISAPTRDVCNTDPIADKFKSFGWEVIEVDGHDVDVLEETFHSLPLVAGKPSMVIAHTVKGKGISYMENVLKWHHGVPSEEQYAQAQKELDEALSVI